MIKVVKHDRIRLDCGCNINLLRGLESYFFANAELCEQHSKKPDNEMVRNVVIAYNVFLNSDKIKPALSLDTDTSLKARAVHRVIRAMHDGACPNCGHLSDTLQVHSEADYYCQKCGFSIPYEFAQKGIAEFQPYMQESVKIFKEWLENERNTSGDPRTST